jgi:DNA-binding Lrp family transcriptional regulator
VKKKINVIVSEESLANLATFTDIEDMNKTVRTYRDVIKASVKRSDVQNRLIALLELLKRHSCKNIGVSFMRKNTIAKQMELSYKTIQRLVKKLEHLKMIKQIEMKRQSDMLQTSNAVVILPVEEKVSYKETTKKPEKCPTKKTKSIFLKQKIKDIVNKKAEPIFTNELIDMANSFYNEMALGRWTKKQWITLVNKLVDEILTNGSHSHIQDVKAYIKGCLNNCCIKHDKKHGKISVPSWGCWLVE